MEKEGKKSNAVEPKDPTEKTLETMNDKQVSNECFNKVEQNVTSATGKEKYVKKIMHGSTSSKRGKRNCKQTNTVHDDQSDKVLHKRRKKNQDKNTTTHSFDEMARLMNDNTSYTHQEKPPLCTETEAIAKKSGTCMNAYSTETKNHCKINGTIPTSKTKHGGAIRGTVENETLLSYSRESSSTLFPVRSEPTQQKQHQNNERATVLRDSKDVKQGHLSDAEQTPKFQIRKSAGQKFISPKASEIEENEINSKQEVHKQKLEVLSMKSAREFPSVEVIRKKDLREQLHGKVLFLFISCSPSFHQSLFSFLFSFIHSFPSFSFIPPSSSSSFLQY